MRLPTVTFHAPHSARTWTLGPGAIIGRMPAAALRLDDPAVSEAHALVSLRGDGLHLLRLRGRLLVDGRPEDDLELERGLSVEFAPGVHLVVQEVSLPEVHLALRDPQGTTWNLLAAVASLYVEPQVDLVPALHRDAAAVLWSDSEGWWIQVDQQRPRPLRAGGALPAPLGHLEVVEVPLTTGRSPSTHAAGRAALTLIARHTCCHIQRPGQHTAILDTQPGRVLSELVSMAAPVPWEVLAGELWPELDPNLDRDRLRKNFDRVLRRLRLKLREHNLRDDLVRSDGQGNYELLLHAGDTTVDEA